MMDVFIYYKFGTKLNILCSSFYINFKFDIFMLEISCFFILSTFYIATLYEEQFLLTVIFKKIIKIYYNLAF